MRRLFPVVCLLALAGCGFQPLYGPTGHGKPEVAAQLQNVFVANIPERAGQQLRLALQEAMGGAAPQEPDGYTLRVTANFAAQAIDIHGDNTSGRMRESVSAHWRLYTVAQAPVLLAQGDASTLDGFDPTFEQYFAQTMDQENTEARAAKTLADTITQQVTVWFRTHTQPAVANKTDVQRYFDPNAIPDANGQPLERAGVDGVPASATGRLDPNENGQ